MPNSWHWFARYGVTYPHAVLVELGDQLANVEVCLLVLVMNQVV
jgi:hypothetical protein